MSKKPAPSRLDALFAGFERTEPSLPQAPTAALPGWTWEANSSGIFVACGPEIAEALGISPMDWSGQSVLTYRLSPRSSSALRRILEQDIFPVELEVEYLNRDDGPVLARMTLFERRDDLGSPSGWRGFSQVIASAPVIPELTRPVKPQTGELKRRAGMPSGVAVVGGQVVNAGAAWSEAGRLSVSRKESIAQVSADASHAALAVPFSFGEDLSGLIEMVDDHAGRKWSEDDLQLAQDVARQLALALENARLYATVQQELGERIRAEQETTRRNQELRLLNQVGQQLSKLTSRQELLALVQRSINELVDARNLTIALFNSLGQTVSFPIHTVNSEPVARRDRPLGSEVVDYVIKTRKPLLLVQNLRRSLIDLGIPLPDPLPLSLMALPMLAGDRPVGAIMLVDHDHESAYNNLDLDLLSTIAANATTALENSNLFQEISNALQTLETRERYQANVAKAVATLSQFGTQALPDVLNTLSLAARNSRTVYAAARQDENGLRWHNAAEWSDPGFSMSVKPASTSLAVADFPHWASALRDQGYVIGITDEMLSPEREYLLSQGISSIMLIAVQSKTTAPGFLAFEQFDEKRRWLAEEVNVLRVAADALANTIVREDLVVQLQSSLDETESLYNASHRLALASNFDEMLAALTQDLPASTINRGELILFSDEPAGKPQRYIVQSSWSSDSRTPARPSGIELPRAAYERLFTSPVPLFIDDIYDAQLDSPSRDLLAQQNIRSLAVLPLRAGKRQLGVTLLTAEAKHQFTGRETRSYPPLADQMATAIENQILFEQTQQALAETESLYNISSGIAQANDPAALASLVAEKMLFSSVDQSFILLTNYSATGQVSEYEIVGHMDRLRLTTFSGQKFTAAELPFLHAVNDTQVIADIDHSALDSTSKRELSQLGVQSLCVVPLRSTGRTVGYIIGSNRKATGFATPDVHLVNVASSGMAVALERYRLLNEAQRRALELQTAAEIARDTTGTLAINELLSRIVHLLQARFGFYHVSIYLVDENNNFASIRESTGEAGEELKRRNFKLAVGARSIIGSAASSGSPVVINDVSQSPIYLPNPLLPDTRSEVGLPLKSGDKVTGVLDIQSREINAFNPDDLTVLQILADQIAVAFENASAYELSQQAYEDMKEVDRVKSQFLANMSHELRTPLNSIIGFSRVILKGIDGPINDTQKQDLTAIYSSGQHLLTLINNILDLSKIEAGKMELQLTDVNLADMINSVMSTAVGLVKDKPVKLFQNVPADLPMVRADQTRVRQILLNFVSNAAKFTEEGSITIEAQPVTGPRRKKEVMVTITDTGGGIAPEDQGKLFQPFSQVDDSPTRKTGGTGLGLSICRSMVEMHGGRIGLLQSEVGKGSTFFFTLPTVLQEPEPEEPPAPGAKVILCVDDDPQVISLYDRLLKAQGYAVVPLSDPKEAVRMAKEVHPYAITLDIMMPEVDGWQVLQRLKNDAETASIPIIICSILEDEEKGFSLGAADYLVKPFVVEDLISAVARLNRDGKIHNIMVIDDDPADLRLVQKMLEESGKFTVTPVDGGRKGWEAIHLSRPDAVIMDLFMPDMDGFTLLSSLRAEKSLSDLPVIVLTGADLTPEQATRMTQLGQQMLTKGLLRENDLLTTLENALRQIQS